MNYLRFQVKDDKLLFTYNGKDYVINSKKDWADAVEDIRSDPDHELQSFQCSSSVDFPEEYTDNQDLIELCYAIRSM
jgi:hypothetical protein